MNNCTMLGDERRASWKVLLPLLPETRVLVLGGDAWLVLSLARSRAKVDWFSGGRDSDPGIDFDGDLALSGERIHIFESLDGNMTTYDIVVIADKKWLGSSAFKTIVLFLKSDGILVQVGLSFRPWSRKRFLRWGVDHYIFLSALPVSAPRLFFPLLPSEFCQLSLSFHVPGSCKARFGVVLLKLAVRFGFETPLRRRGIVFSSREKIKDRTGTLALWLSERLSLQIKDIAIYCGSESPRRKMTLLVGAVGSDGPVFLVVKVADTEAGADAIQQESATLHYLVQRDVTFRYPRLLFEGRWHNHPVQVQQAFSPKLDFSGTALGDIHFEALTSFSWMARKSVDITETREWNRVERAWHNCEDYFPSVLQSLWDGCVDLETKFGNMIPVHFVHGDFTSWNMRCQNNQLAIFDWEDSFLQGLPFYDLFRFIYRQASLVGPWPGGEGMYALLVEKANFLSCKANYDFSLFGKVMPLLLMYEYLERPHSHLVEVADSFLRAQ